MFLCCKGDKSKQLLVIFWFKVITPPALLASETSAARYTLQVIKNTGILTILVKTIIILDVCMYYGKS